MAPGRRHLSSDAMNACLQPVCSPTLDIELPEFGSIVVAGDYPVTVTVGGERYAMAIDGLDGDASSWQPSVDDGTLRLPAAASCVPTSITIALPQLARLAHRGAGLVHVEAPRTRRLELYCRGPGTLRAHGVVGYLKAVMAASGHLDLVALRAIHAWIINNGTGAILATVRRTMQVDPLGPGRIAVNAADEP